jgi:protein CMS1
MGYVPEAEGGEPNFTAKRLNSKLQHSQHLRGRGWHNQKLETESRPAKLRAFAMSTEDDLQEPLLERLSATPELEPKSTGSTSKKRKRGVVEQGAKRAAKKTKSKKNAIDEDELDVENCINKAFSHMDNQLLADYIAQRTRKYESDLSSIELEDKHIPGILCRNKVGPVLIWASANAIRDTTSWDKPRTLDTLPSFLEKFSGNSTKLWSASKKNGTPHTIIVTAAGLRAADIARYLLCSRV